MKPKALLVLAVAVWLAAVGQQAFFVPGARAAPDLYLVLIGASAPLLNRWQTTWLGFVCGLTHGACAGANMTAYIVSRTITAFFAGWANDLRIAPSFWLASITSAIATLFAQLGMLFLAVPRNIEGFIADTILTAVYNGVLALLLYAVLSRLLDPDYR